MKPIHALLVAAGMSSLAPAALADQPGKPFTITVASAVTPVTHAQIGYPFNAGTRGLEGSCDVSFVISTAGKADAIRISACTSDMFRASAKKIVEAMTFAPRVAAEGATATINWTMNSAPAMRTASLD
jgi:TonB family protein